MEVGSRPKKCVLHLKGLRILRQPIDQTLFFFILSSAKSIKQIQAIGDAVFKNSVEKYLKKVLVFLAGTNWLKFRKRNYEF